MSYKKLLLFSLIFLGSYFSSKSQTYCDPNIDFELGNTSYWTYYRGTNTLVGSAPVWTMVTCPPAPTLHTITSGSTSTDPFGGFSTVGDGLYSLKIGKDSANYNADGASYMVHVPSGSSTAYSLIYRYAIVFEDPSHTTTNQPRFEIEVTDSATGTVIPCNSFSFVSSSILPGFVRSSVGSRPYYKDWTAGSINLTTMAGKTVKVLFRVGGCTQSGHWGYAYVDMNCGIFKIQTVGCSGGMATITAPPGYSGYTWTDSLTYTAAYGTTQTVTVPVPTVSTTYAVILTPYTGYGCPDTLYARLIPSNMSTSPARDTSICYGATVKIWGGGKDILPLTYAWSPTTGLSCSSCDTTFATPPVGVNKYISLTTNTGGCLKRDTVKVTVYPIAAAISGNKNVCLGYTTGLSDAVPGGSWTSGNTAVATVGSGTGVVTAVALGTANITYSFAGICPVVTTVTVQPLPSAITGSSIVCVAFTTTFSDATTPGTWSSSATAIATVGSGTGVVTGMSPGTALITYTASSTTCFVTKVVTVIPLPTAISGLTTICQYSNTTLLSSSGGTWSSSNTAVATVGSSTGDVYGASAGTATITYTIGTGCYVTTTMNVLLSPSPITGTMSLCQGSTSALTDVIGGGVWSTSDPTVATVGTTGIVTGVGPVTARISYSLPTGCRALATVTVNPLPNPITGPSNVCLGQTITLSDAMTGGKWSSSNTNAVIGSSSGIVTGNNVGTSTITYTSAAGCIITTTVSVDANPTSILGTKSVCAGQTVCLSNATTGGTWTSSSLPIASIGSSTGCVTGVASGTSTITYRLSTGCFTTAVVTVNALPAPISGTLKMCVGNTSTLTDFTTGGTWSSSNTAVATIGSSTGIATGMAGGTATITYTVGSGCFVTATATVNALPASITGATTVCVGATTALSSTTGGGVWTTSNSAVATVTSSGVVTGVLAGTAVISYTVFSTGCATTATVTVGPAPGPIGGAVFGVCIGANITLTDAVTGGGWTSGNTAVAAIDFSTGVVTGVAVGTASITYSLGGSCKVNKTVTVYPIPAAITGTASMCVFASTTLTDATTGGTWSSSNSAIASVVSGGLVTAGSTAGTAIISYTTSAFGCSATRVVTVDPLPAAISGIKTLCVGGTTTLTDITPGGTWSSGGPTIAIIGSSSGVVTSGPGAPGSATIIYKVTSTGCSISTVVTVNPLPAAIAGPVAVCELSNITLTNSSTGGTWSSLSTNVAVGSSTGIVSGIPGGAGVATITYTLGTSCAITTPVTVNPLPPVSTGPTAVCIGKTITLSNSVPGGTWMSGNTGILTVGSTSGVVTGGSTLSCAPIIYTLATGCQRSTTVCVSPSPSAISGSFGLCVGTSVTLSDAITGGSWSASPTTVGTIDATTGSFYGVGAGTATVVYSLGSGCTVSQVMTVNPLPSVISGGGAVCLSDTLTLTDLTPGGTWTSSNPTVATVGLLSGVVHPGTVGTTTITYSLGCVVTTTVTVALSPAVTTGPSTVCEGVTITLNNAVGGGTWTSGSPSVASIVTSTGGTADVKGISSGTASITYSLGGSCLAVHNVLVNASPVVSGSASICTGNKTTLVSTLPGGTWTSSNTGVATIGTGTGVVTGVAPGTSVIVKTLPTGCFGSLTVNVSSTPVAITGTKQVCLGETVTLSNGSTGGVWSSTSTNVSVNSTSGDVTGVRAGTAVVDYSLGSGCNVTAVVTVNPLPAAIGGASNLCASSTATVTTTSTGGTWSTGTSSILSITPTTGVVSGLTAGTGFVTYTTAFGCIASKAVTVNALPGAIIGTTNVCVGVMTPLTNSSVGTWMSSNSTIASIGSTSGLATGVAPGAVVITFKASSTGCSVTTPFNVLKKDTIIAPTGPVCVGQTYTLSNATLGGVWSSGNTGIATIDPATGAMNAVASGTVLISYVIGGTCPSIKNIVVNPISPVVGPNILCAGQSVKLLDTTLGGIWTSSNTSVATINPTTGVASGVTGSTGFASIFYTTPIGCRATHAVTVNAVPKAIIGSDQLCLGQATSYSSLTPFGTWSSTNTGVADFITPGVPGDVTGIAIGRATISYTAAGCAATKAVTVNTLPAAISGITDVCVGSTTVLTSLTPGGTWASGTPAVATVGITSGAVTGVTTGTSNVKYIATTGCAVNVNVNVHPNPLPILGATTQVCVGSTIALTSGTPGGAWSSSAPATADVSGGIVTGYVAGTAIISYATPAHGCSSRKVVTVNPIPGAIIGSEVCEGSTVTLSSPTSGGSWTSSDPSVATIGLTTGIATGVVAGTSTVSYTLGGTGCAVAKDILVNPKPAPITGPNSVCVGITTYLFNTTIGGIWSSSDGSVASIALPGFSGDVKGEAKGVATISYTIPGTGCAQTASMVVTDKPTPITGNPNVCLGSSYTFKNSTPGGSWSSTDPTVATVDPVTGVVKGISLGYATIIYTMSAGCDEAININVVPLPTQFTVTGGGTFCSDLAGVNVGLTGSVTGTNYFLYKGGVLATGPLAGTDLALDFGKQAVAGIYTVIATNTMTGCSNNMLSSVTVSVNPVVYPKVNVTTGTGDTVVCSGATTVFSGTTTGGGTAPTFKWDVNGYIVASGSAPYSYIPADGDVVTMTMVSTEVCARPATVSGKVTMKVVTPATPSAVLSSYPGDTVCQGLPVTMTAIPTFGGSAPTYTWVVNKSTVGSGPSFTFVPVDGDVVYAEMTSNYGCLVTAKVPSNSVKMSVVAPVVPFISISADPGTNVALGQKVTLTANVTGGGATPSYQWSVNSIPVAGATNRSFTDSTFSLDKDDSVSVSVTSSGPCRMTTHQWVYMSVHPVGVKQVGVTASNLSVQPNPNKGVFTVKGSLGTSNDAEVTVELTNLLGQVVYKNNVIAKGGIMNEQVTLKNTLANGMYMLTVRSEAGLQVFHVVIEQ